MNKKGFTMVELLAVITILGVVMAIAIPAVTSQITTTSSKYYEDLEKDVELAVRDFMNDHRSYLPKENSSSCYITKSHDLVGYEYIKSISDKKGNDCDYVIKVTRNNPNDYSYEGYVKCSDYTSDNFTTDNLNLCGSKLSNENDEETSEDDKNSVKKTWSLTTDNNGNGSADIGDLICVSTECFYVYSNDGTNIKALAQYNLYVGGTYNADNRTWTAYGSEATGLQNSQMKGFVSFGVQYYGVTDFASSSQHGTNYSDYTGSIVEGYVNQYATKLSGMNANIISARLITKEEIETLVNNGNTLECGDYISSTVDIAGKEWVYSTSYWFGSADGDEYVYFVEMGYFDSNYYEDGYDVGDGKGVRPVITIVASEI